ncbi:MAG: RES domain-containing protein [Gammaproteobacteria bacterium]
MPKLPRAPDLKRLRSYEPATFNLKAGSVWHRLYSRGGDHPTSWDALRYFGPTLSRFDHQVLDEHERPHMQNRGISYFAGDIPTCLAEVFQTTRTIDRKTGHPWLASFKLQNDIALLDLTDTFPVKSGASMKLVSGPRVYAQNWSRGFYDCFPEIDGLYFLSSMTNRPLVALYERALSKSVFPDSPEFHRPIDDPLLLRPLKVACLNIGYDLAPDIT